MNPLPKISEEEEDTRLSLQENSSLQAYTHAHTHTHISMHSSSGSMIESFLNPDRLKISSWKWTGITEKSNKWNCPTWVVMPMISMGSRGWKTLSGRKRGVVSKVDGCTVDCFDGSWFIVGHWTCRGWRRSVRVLDISGQMEHFWRVTWGGSVYKTKYFERNKNNNCYYWLAIKRTNLNLVISPNCSLFRSRTVEIHFSPPRINSNKYTNY